MLAEVSGLWRTDHLDLADGKVARVEAVDGRGALVMIIVFFVSADDVDVLADERRGVVTCGWEDIARVGVQGGGALRAMSALVCDQGSE